MSTHTHTPGPWVRHPRFPEYIVPVEHENRPVGGAADPERDLAEFAQHVAIVPKKHRHRSQAEQDDIARLIAAAPELFAACEAIVDSHEADDNITAGMLLGCAYEIARAAIAKARP